MKREDAIAALKNEADAVKARGATALYLFGSTARDEARNESDVDLFIDYAHGTGFSLIELLGIKHHLEDRLGVAIDVTTRDGLHPLLKKKIEETAERVF
jgi:predicted nucleotidyltransferase